MVRKIADAGAFCGILDLVNRKKEGGDTDSEKSTISKTPELDEVKAGMMSPREAEMLLDYYREYDRAPSPEERSKMRERARGALDLDAAAQGRNIIVQGGQGGPRFLPIFKPPLTSITHYRSVGNILNSAWKSIFRHSFFSLMLLAVPAITATSQVDPAHWPLSRAVVSNDLNSTKKLLAVGRSQDEIDYALIAAAGKGRSEAALLLLAVGASPNRQVGPTGISSVIVAVRENQPDTLIVLLEHGGDPNAKDRLGWRPLHHTVVLEYERPNAIRALIQYGAVVDGRDELQRTVLHRAAGFGHAESVKLLLALGADSFLRDKYGNTAAERAQNAGHGSVAALIQRYTATSVESSAIEQLGRKAVDNEQRIPDPKDFLLDPEFHRQMREVQRGLLSRIWPQFAAASRADQDATLDQTIDQWKRYYDVQESERTKPIMLLSITINWLIGLLPVALLRFVIFKRPLSKRSALLASVGVCALLLIVFTALGQFVEAKPNVFPVYIWTLITYWVLKAKRTTTQSDGSNKEESQFIETNPPAHPEADEHYGQWLQMLRPEYSGKGNPRDLVRRVLSRDQVFIRKTEEKCDATANSPSITEAAPKGIGGWLLIFCIGLVILSPLYNFVRMIIDWAIISLASEVAPSLKYPVMFENFGMAAIIIAGIVVGIIIWSGSHDGRKIAKVYLKARVVCFVAVESLTIMLVGGPTSFSTMVPSDVGAFIGGIVSEGAYFLIWWSYFKKSKRVKNTYGP